MASERPFFAVMVFAILLVVFAHSVGCVRIPEWSNLNVGLCALGVSFIGINYVNEYMAKFPLSYSKFSTGGQLPPRLAWSVTYASPALLYVLAWSLAGAPNTTFHLAALATYAGHFVKRILECLFVHKYSKKVEVGSAIEIAMFYSLGSVIQHYWCNMYSTPEIAHQLSSNHATMLVGVVVFIVGEGICFYHHALLAGLRPTSGSVQYTVPQGGLFSFVVCPHYTGELIAWYGASMTGQHLGLYLTWLVMVAYLAGRSHQTYLWYKNKMDAFPTNRWNLFPGIF